MQELRERERESLSRDASAAAVRNTGDSDEGVVQDVGRRMDHDHRMDVIFRPKPPRSLLHNIVIALSLSLRLQRVGGAPRNPPVELV